MNTRITAAVLVAASALALTACSSSSDSSTKSVPSPKASKTPSPDRSPAEKAAGIPPKPTGAQRAELLRALAAANPDIVKYEDKAIDAARNQCSSVDNGSGKADLAASQRFTYKDVTTTEAQGKQINQALKGLGFCKV
ncbi:hypothetical protein [Streptomyces sp. NRRL B-3648]|uniref:hypothetical protein n=1 Tax=Streptomyces sp. NRRL B-3648 TaxID=1519493 RepID=UPI0006B050C8|nr:hypothetical protein [Streptomyces sp. NRRL B-3648]KOV92970.1 hypothetical protein ADL04_28625 [Streptomyces sp. NRRL B-3648]